MIKLEWTYKPENYFESKYNKEFRDFNLEIDKGYAKISPIQQDVIIEELITFGYKCILQIFKIRQVQKHEKFEFNEDVTIYRQLESGQIVKDIRIFFKDSIELKFEGFTADIIISDANNNEIVNTKKDRIINHHKQIDNILKLEKNEVIANLLESYEKAVINPKTELVHLYEIRDAIQKFFNGKNNAIEKLNFGSNKWDKLGLICNALPLNEGRHSGLKEKLRNADESELNEARQITSELITAFISYANNVL